MKEEALIQPSPDYRKLYSYQKSDAIMQMTVIFCNRFVGNGFNRTVDQMVQAARSVKQNIAEGSKRHSTSTSGEINLLGVAFASLFELLEDYLDYLKINHLELWAEESEQFRWMREHGAKRNDAPFYTEFAETRPAETVANIAIIAIQQCAFLLDRHLKSLGQSFLEEGGFKERMTRLRLQRRERR